MKSLAAGDKRVRELWERQIFLGPAAPGFVMGPWAAQRRTRQRLTGERGWWNRPTSTATDAPVYAEEW